MSNNGGFSKSSKGRIPNTLMKTILHIKEIAKNHSEDDIYAMLKECSMDPNETTQRLLYLDTFHVVKSKRDKRKEQAVKSKPGEDPKWNRQDRGPWRDRGNTYSKYSGDGSLGRRNFNQKAQGVKERGKVFRKATTYASKEADTVPEEKALSISIDEQVKKCNSNLGGAHDSKPYGLDPRNSEKSVKDGSDSLPNASTVDAPSASDPVLVPLDSSWVPTAIGAIKKEAFSSVVQREPSKPSNVAKPNVLRESIVAEKSHDPCSVSGVRPSSLQGGRLLPGAEVAVSETAKTKILDRQHVIIPDHIQVPDAVKNVLSFGSIDACFRVAYAKNNNKDLHSACDVSPDKATDISSSCDKDAVSTLRNAEYTEKQWPQSHLPDEKYPMDIKVSSSATNNDQLKQDNLPAVGPPFPLAHTMPGYIGFMPPMLANTFLRSGGIENLAHFSNSLHGDLPARSTESSTPPSSQSSGAGHAPIAVSPQPVPLFNQPYPPNYIPYNPYFSPFYVPPNMLQYYGQTPFPPSLPNGNVLLPTPAAMKNSPLHIKVGANTENQVAATTSGNPSTSDGLMPTALKDKDVYSGQQSEGYGAWLPPVNFPISSFVNFPQGQQHLINPQLTHGGFTVYRTLQPISTAASPGQPVTGEVE